MGIKIIAKNKRASYDFQLLEKLEVGLSLQGTEVKSLREGKVSLNESFIVIDKNDEAWIQNMTIAQYDFGNINNHQETRRRKLLLHKKEIQKWKHMVSAQGLTLVPTMIYFSKSHVKLEVALAKGKKVFDKRADAAKKDVEKKLRRGDYD